MSNSSNVTSLCISSDKLCIAREYEKEVIVVPTLLLAISVGTFLTLCFLRLCAKKEVDTVTVHSHQHAHSHNTQKEPHSHRHNTNKEPHSHRHNTNKEHHSHRHNTQGHQSQPHNTLNKQQHRNSRQQLQGIDAPPGLNPLEYEAVPMTPQTRSSQAATLSQSTERELDSFQEITPMALSFAVKPDSKFTLYRATMDRRAVVLRVLKETASVREHNAFLGFAQFLTELGPHPCLPSLMGVVTVRSPLIMMLEELENRDLLGFLWRCRQDHQSVAAPCDLTERRIFTMGRQIASALEYLQSKNCIHGNIGARSVLVARDLSVKLWGLGPAFRRRTETDFAGEVEEMVMRKWQAPEVLAVRPASYRSDIWSFGILLYEMVTLGDPPFPRIMASELLQYLQRGKTLRRPANCSNTLHAIMKDCCQWSPQDRASLGEVISKLQMGERTANDTAVLRVPEALDFEKYMREAGYGESYNYAVL